MNRPISPPPTKRQKLSARPEPPALPLPFTPSSPNRDSSILRIYSWNINGITPFLPNPQKPITNFFKPTTQSPSPTPPSLRTFLHRHNWPQILCLQEVKIAHADTKTQDLVRKAVNPFKSRDSPFSAGENEEHEEDDAGPAYDVFFTLPTDRFNARGPRNNGKIYGVCSIIRRDFQHTSLTRVRDVDWDDEGRISIIELQTPGPKAQELAIWNIYAVNGTSNPWRDPETGEVIGTRHDKKLHVHERMMRDCVSMSASGCRILIIGDLNVAPSGLDGYPNLRVWPAQHVKNRADFNDKFLDEKGDGKGFQGVDVWRFLRGRERRYTYFPRGVEWGSSCDRVDSAIASRSMVEGGEIVGV